MKPSVSEGPVLVEALSKFLKLSETILHLDVSSINMPPEACLYLMENGLRKSRTLLALHMGGMGYLPE